MAKTVEHLKVLPFIPKVIPFPKTQLCGCGCGTLLNDREDAFIKSDALKQWYTDEVCFLKAVRAVEFNGFYRFMDAPDYRYTKKEFYEELQAYWNDEYAPIA